MRLSAPQMALYKGSNLPKTVRLSTKVAEIRCTFPEVYETGVPASCLKPDRSETAAVP